MTVNFYSQTWCELFLETRAYTEQEANFIMRQLPNPPYAKVLDLCCGRGRLTNRLATQGYEMVGVDVDAEALALAEQRASASVTYLRKDMRKIDEVQGQFDAVLCLWQSFGYFGELVNRSVLEKLIQKLRPGGRLILDLYNLDYWRAHQGVQRLERNGVEVQVINELNGNRLKAHLDYGKGQFDTFEWQLYTPEEIRMLAAVLGLRSVMSCTECNERKPITADTLSMQLVFEKIPHRR